MSKKPKVKQPKIEQQIITRVISLDKDAKDYLEQIMARISNRFAIVLDRLDVVLARIEENNKIITELKSVKKGKR